MVDRSISLDKTPYMVIEPLGVFFQAINQCCLMFYLSVNHGFMERGSSVVECRTRNQVSPGSNPSLLPFRRLGIFVLSIDAPVHSAV